MHRTCRWAGADREGRAFDDSCQKWGLHLEMRCNFLVDLKEGGSQSLNETRTETARPALWHRKFSVRCDDYGFGAT